MVNTDLFRWALDSSAIRAWIVLEIRQQALERGEREWLGQVLIETGCL